jgi:nicotinamidase-related amidase
MNRAGRTILRALIAGLGGAALAWCAAAATIIDQWSSVKAPPAPTLQRVAVDPGKTAVLVLDFFGRNCSPRPRCVASLPQVAKLLAAAHASHAFVVYSLVRGTSMADVLPQVKPAPGEPSVTSGPDKFLGTDLDKILKARGITTVVPVGTAAEGAVLYTASHAALTGYNVVLPVDGMSSTTPYAEQYVAWNMAHAPTVGRKTQLTAIDLIKF